MILQKYFHEAPIAKAAVQQDMPGYGEEIGFAGSCMALRVAADVPRSPDGKTDYPWPLLAGGSRQYRLLGTVSDIDIVGSLGPLLAEQHSAKYCASDRLVQTAQQRKDISVELGHSSDMKHRVKQRLVDLN